MSGVVAKRVAVASDGQVRQRIIVPLGVDGRPAAPTQRSREIGWSMIPRIGRLRQVSAINVPNGGTRLIKDFVPSIGSKVQTNSASSRTRPNSSPTMPWFGKCCSISERIACSAARSAAVAGVRSALSSTVRGLRKYGRIASPAASANRSASARKWSTSVGSTGLFQRFEIGDDIGTILPLGDAGEGHLGALDQGVRLPQPLVELFRIPLFALVRCHCGGKLVAGDAGHRLLGDVPQIRPDLVRPTLVEGVALDADLGNLLASLRIGLGQQRLDRLPPGRGTLLPRTCARRWLRAGDHI